VDGQDTQCEHQLREVGPLVLLWVDVGSLESFVSEDHQDNSRENARTDREGGVERTPVDDRHPLGDEAEHGRRHHDPRREPPQRDVPARADLREDEEGKRPQPRRQRGYQAGDKNDGEVLDGRHTRTYASRPSLLSRK
jgi:hypothetical protein